VTTYPLDEVYCDISLRHTYLSGKALYAHRGLFKVHEPVARGIDDVWMINLDRRKDRLAKFLTNPLHADLAQRLLRLRAFDGSQLKLTPKIARLFRPNDFAWKKPIMGCALSHLALWMKLIHDKQDVNSYLILEDEIRREHWKQNVIGESDEIRAYVEAQHNFDHIPKDERVRLYLIDYNEQDIERAKEKIEIGCVLYNQLMNQ
jgi:hypothetical protein